MTSDGSINSVDTNLELVEVLAEIEGAGVSELADEVDLPVSTVFDHLTTLQNRGFVVQKEGAYHVGLKYLALAQKAKNAYEVYHVSRGELRDLADETGESAWLVVEEHGRGVMLDVALGDKAVRTYYHPGKHHHIHSIAAGKALLAHLPDARVHEIIETHGLDPITENTITDEAELLEELETIRETGVAFNDNEDIQGLLAIASPIVHEDGVAGAVSVSGPSHRLGKEETRENIAELVQGTANAIELKLSYE